MTRCGRIGLSSERYSGASKYPCFSRCCATRRVAAAFGARTHGFEKLPEDLRRVAEHDVFGRVIPRRVARLDVDLHEILAGRIEELCVLPGGVARPELRADDEHEIGVAEASIRRGGAERAEHAKRQGMGFREGALAGGGRRDRQTGRLGERAQFFIGLGNADAVAGDDDRPLGGEKLVGDGGDLRRIGRRRRCGQIEPGRVKDRLRVGRDIAGQCVVAEEDRDGAGLARHRMLDRELRRLHRGGRLLRLHDLLGDAAEGAAGVPAAPIAGRLLIGRVQGKPRGVAEIGQQQHR